MNPQLVITDFGGAHNADLGKTRARLIQGASWKRQRIIVILPADSLMPAKCALAMWNLAFPPNNGVVRILAQGMEVGHAYSAAIEGILAHDQLRDWEYILTIESDNAPPADGVVKLIETMEARPELACVGGLYFTKGDGGCAQIWGDPADPVLNFRPLMPIPDQLVECCGTGMGFNLWRIKMFHDGRLRRPWFVTLDGKGGTGIGTQDLYFWSDARKYGYRCAVDCRVKVGHFDAATDMMW